jgi:hypothetical protein
MNMHRQNAQLLDLFKRDGTVTRLTAMHYGIANVTARIADLRLRHGINVVCEKRTDAKGKTYGAWSIKKDGSAAKVGDKVRVQYLDPASENREWIGNNAEGEVVYADLTGLCLKVTKGFAKNGETWWVSRKDVIVL